MFDFCGRQGIGLIDYRDDDSCESLNIENFKSSILDEN